MAVRRRAVLGGMLAGAAAVATSGCIADTYADTGGQPTKSAQPKQSKPSDRITVVDDETGLNRDFFIEQIQHQIPLGGLLHSTTFGCEAVPAPGVSPFTFDDATNGKFGTGRFATLPLDSSTEIFIFDHATQGKFGTGKFAT